VRSLFNSVYLEVTQYLIPLFLVLVGHVATGAQAYGGNDKLAVPRVPLGLDSSGCASSPKGSINRMSPISPIAARYLVTIDRARSGQALANPQRLTWYFYRSEQQIALLKGGVDEVWVRDTQNRISFERVFHADERVVDYRTGELATLHVKVDWSALSCFVDPAELAQLKQVSRTGKGPNARWRMSGALSDSMNGGKYGGMQVGLGKDRLTVDWLPALQLPQRLTRNLQDGTTVQMELVASAPDPLPGWPQVGAQSAHYLHLDAADFGDMDYDPVVRKSEALDIRSGWRAAHRHD
jgi:hypothetical protein